MLLESIALSLATTQPADFVIDPAEPQSVARALRREGYLAMPEKKDGGHRQIRSAAYTHEFLIGFLDCDEGEGCRNIAMLANFGKGERSDVVQRLNALHHDFRYVQFYLNEEGYPTAWMDFQVADGPIERQTFSDALDLFTQTLPEVHDSVFADD